MAGGEKNVLVVDASVVVKWFVLEEYSDEAGLLKRAYVEGLVDLASPSLLLYEVLNALKYSAAFGEDELKRIARVLEDYQFTLLSSPRRTGTENSGDSREERRHNL